jgi:hypothetical protein
MPKVKVGKPPAGLQCDQLHVWYQDAFEDAYEKALFDYREARRQAKVETVAAKVEELKKQLPGDDGVVLKGKDAERRPS